MSAMRTGRRRRALVALGVAVVLVSPAGLPARAAACRHQRLGPWTSVDLPDFPLSVLHSHEDARGLLSPRTFVFTTGGSRQRLFASDGVSVRRSLDGGCNWTLTFSLDPTLDSTTEIAGHGAAARLDPAARIMLAVAPPRTSTRGGDHVYLLARNWAGLLFVAASADGGGRWRLSHVPAAEGAATPIATGSPCALVAAPSDSRVAYLAYQEQNRRRLVATEDGGATWHPRADPPAAVCAPSTASQRGPLVVDPQESRTLWTLDSDLVRSLDGGRRWTATRAPWAGRLFMWARRLDVVHPAGRPAGLVVFVDVRDPDQGTGTNTGVYYVTADAGRTWRRTVSPYVDQVHPNGYAYWNDVRLSARGDVLGLLQTAPSSTTFVLYRYDMGRRRWSSLGRPPGDGAPGAIDGFLPVDAGRRYFMTWKRASTQQTLLVFDSGALA